jgi:hypothetical protein
MSPELTKQLLTLCTSWHNKAAKARIASRELKIETKDDLVALKELHAKMESLDDCGNELSNLVYQIVQASNSTPNA